MKTNITKGDVFFTAFASVAVYISPMSIISPISDDEHNNAIDTSYCRPTNEGQFQVVTQLPNKTEPTVLHTTFNLQHSTNEYDISAWDKPNSYNGNVEFGVYFTGEQKCITVQNGDRQENTL